MSICNKVFAVLLGAVALSCSVTAVAAEATVETRSVATWQRGGQATRPTSKLDQLLELQLQLEAVQREVQELRGMIENNQFHLGRLDESQGDLYADLERRITEFSAKMAQPIAVNAESSNNVSQAADPWPESEKAHYQKAYDALHAKDYTQALTLFQGYLTKYPTGQYKPNVNYWLGEIFLIGGDSAQADLAFEEVVRDFPEHQKASDALLKRGYVAYAQEQWMQANAYFNDVKVRYPGTSAARLAEARLIEMKQESHL